jgi:arsenate reductase-like glutaredoxin family protein
MEREKQSRQELTDQINQISDQAAELRSKDDKHFEQLQTEMQKILDEKEDIS